MIKREKKILNSIIRDMIHDINNDSSITNDGRIYRTKIRIGDLQSLLIGNLDDF